jgi:acetyl esterase/lipase
MVTLAEWPSESSYRREDFGGGSICSRFVNLGLRATVRPAIGVWAQYPTLPWPYFAVDYAGWLVRPPIGTRIKPVRLPRTKGLWIDRSNHDGAGVILYLHGGAFMTCRSRIHRRLIAQVSGAAAAPALAVDYRMMPKHSTRDAIDDCVDGYRWLLDRGYSGRQIVLAGDSAGGYLVFAVASRLAELGWPGPAGIVALSPMTDTDPARKLGHTNARTCAVFPRSALPAFRDFADAVDRRLLPERPGQFSPVDADLSVMPPTLIQVSSTEILYPDAVLMVQRLAEAGARCVLQVWDGQPHVFQAGAGVIPEADRAIAKIGTFIREELRGIRAVPPRSNKPSLHQLRDPCRRDPARGGRTPANPARRR